MESWDDVAKQRERRIYRWCTAAFVLFGILLVSLLVVLSIFPKRQGLHNLIGFTWMASFIPAIVAANALSKLHLTQHIGLDAYTLPYKLGKERFYYYFFGGAAIMMTLLTLPILLQGHPLIFTQSKGGPEMFRLPAWTGIPLLIWLPMGLVVFLVMWQGIVLYSDHLFYYMCLSKHRIPYKDIESVAVERRVNAKGGTGYFLIIRHHARQRRGYVRLPLTIALQPYPAKDCVIMFDVLAKAAPQAEWNEMALGMRAGEFPR